MEKIVIHKEKIIFNKWDEASKTWIEEDILNREGDIVRYLNKVTEFHPDLTIEDFMNHLRNYEAAIDYCFYDYTRGYPMKVFFEDMDQENTEQNDLGDVELAWEGEVMGEDLLLLGYLRAWPTEEKILELGPEYEVPYDVSFSSISSWKKCKFILNENMAILSDDKEPINKELIFQGYYKWTLFEVISNFLIEISINGSPAERDALYAQMKDKKIDIKEVAKDKEKSDFWLMYLQNQIENFKLQKEKALDNEDYEVASKMKKEIEILEKEFKELQEEIKKYE